MICPTVADMPPTPTAEPVLTTEEFAQAVKLHIDKVRQRIRRGEIRAHDINRDKGRPHYRIPASEVARFLGPAA